MRCLWLYIFLFSFFISASSQKNVTSAEFYELMNNSENVKVLDVRIFEKYAEDRINNAIYVGEKKVLLEFIENIEKENPILLYCDFGERSKAVMKILKRKGFKKIYHLNNGYLEWKENGFPFDDTPIED